MNINWGSLYGCSQKNKERNEEFQKKLRKMHDELGTFGYGLKPVHNGLPKLAIFGGNNDDSFKNRIIEYIFPIYIRDKEDIENMTHEKINSVVTKEQLEIVGFDISLFKNFLKENGLEFIELIDKIIIIHYDRNIISKLIWNFLNCFYIEECQKIIIEEE